MRLTYDVDKIKQLLSAVSGLTGISIAFLNADGEFLYNSGYEGGFCTQIQCDEKYHAMCDCSDRKLLSASHYTGCYESHICYAGLYDAAIPMVKNGVTAGSVIMGRVRTPDSPSVPPIEAGHELLSLYRKTPRFTERQLEYLRILLPNILFESAIEIESDPVMDKIVDYINKNLASDLCLNDLCRRFHISKNTLYERFREQYNCTVNSYIMDRRLELAKQCLVKNDDPIYIIAEQTGFGTGSYFCRLFKKKVGIAPIEFRKKMKTQQ